MRGQDETGIWGIWRSTEGLGGSPGVRDKWEALDGSVMCFSIVSTALSAGSIWRGRGAGEEQSGGGLGIGGSGNGEGAAEFPPHLHPAHSSLTVDPYGDRAVSHPSPGDASPGGQGHWDPPGTREGTSRGHSSPSPSSISSSASWNEGLDPGMLQGDRLRPRVPAQVGMFC